MEGLLRITAVFWLNNRSGDTMLSTTISSAPAGAVHGIVIQPLLVVGKHLGSIGTAHTKDPASGISGFINIYPGKVIDRLDKIGYIFRIRLVCREILFEPSVKTDVGGFYRSQNLGNPAILLRCLVCWMIA